MEPDDTPVTKKDSKRVEQGKRLAMILKEAKERKMRAKIEAEMRENRGESIFSSTSSLSSYVLPGSIVVSSIFFLGCWFFLSRGGDNVRKEEPLRVVTVEKKENKFAEL